MRRKTMPAASAAPPVVPVERPHKVRVSFGFDANGWHYVVHLRRDGTIIEQVVDGKKLAGEAFAPKTPVSTVVARALALAARHNIGHIDVSDPQRILLKTSDSAMLPARILRMMAGVSVK